MLPPHESGAPVLLLLSTPFVPPVAEYLANQVANAASTALCVRQLLTMVSIGQVKVYCKQGLLYCVVLQAPKVLVVVEVTQVSVSVL